MKKTKRGPGRPPLPPKDKKHVLAVRVSGRELVEFKKRAKAEGLPLSLWLLLPRRAELENKR